MLLSVQNWESTMEMIVRARVHLIFKMLFILNLALNNKTETSLNAIVYTTFSVQKKKKALN